MSAGHTLDTPGIPGTPETPPGKPADPAIPGGPGALRTRGFPETPGLSEPEEAPQAWEIPWASLRDRARMGIAAVGHGAGVLRAHAGRTRLAPADLVFTLPGPVLARLRSSGSILQRQQDWPLASGPRPRSASAVFLISRLLLVIRRLASLTRRLVGRVVRRAHRRPLPAAARGRRRKASFAERLGWLLTDRATWRDLLWVTVNGCVGWILAVAAGAGLAGARRCRPDRALRLAAGPPAGPRGRGRRVVGGAVAAARLRPAGPLDAGAGRAGRAGAAGPPAVRRPAPRPWTPGRPRSAGSSGTCTTERRPGWSPWA